MKTEPVIELSLILLSFGVVSVISVGVFSQLRWTETIAGWGIAFLNHLAGKYIKQIGMKKKGQEAIQHLSVFNFLRFVLLVALVFCVVSYSFMDHQLFIYALLASYIIFMTSDLVQFYRFYQRKP
ncbi:MAG TPA: hypothetical protein VI749_03035 [Candidatus Omnitrophota bacterium]|nr:hypothetical protein [Candidatus Omnitrophota bacterium]